VLEAAPFFADTRFCPVTGRGAVTTQEGGVLLAVDRLSAGWETILFLIAIVLFLAGFFGFKVTAQRVRLEALGLAVFVFVFFWNAWARV
jgi:hypothetical protein